MMADRMACPKCGAENYVTDPQCLSCGRTLTAPGSQPRQEPAPPAPSAPAPPPAAPVPLGRPMPAAEIARPTGVTLMVVVCDSVAVLALMGLFLVFGLIPSGAIFRAEPQAALVLFVLGFLGLIYFGIIVIGHFVWHGFIWARYTFMVLLCLQVLGNTTSMIARHHLSFIPAVVVVVAVFFLIILNDQDAKDFFTR